MNVLKCSFQCCDLLFLIHICKMCVQFVTNKICIVITGIHDSEILPSSTNFCVCFVFLFCVHVCIIFV
jgi:hypothetical protein